MKWYVCIQLKLETKCYLLILSSTAEKLYHEVLPIGSSCHMQKLSVVVHCRSVGTLGRQKPSSPIACMNFCIKPVVISA